MTTNNESPLPLLVVEKILEEIHLAIQIPNDLIDRFESISAEVPIDAEEAAEVLAGAGIDADAALGCLQEKINVKDKKMNPPNKDKINKLTCAFCGSTDIDTHQNAGWDIDVEGEEDQHLNTCNTCGAECFTIDRYDFCKAPQTYQGKWFKDGEYKEGEAK